MQQTKEVGGSANIPEDANKMYQENEKFVNYVTNLDYTTKSYNKIRLTILDVEKPLVEKQLEEIDRKLMRAEKELSWSTPGRILSFFIYQTNYIYTKKNQFYIHIELFIVDSKLYKGLFCMIVLFCFVMCLYTFIHNCKNKKNSKGKNHFGI